jgi:hypothetical protein
MKLKIIITGPKVFDANNLMDGKNQVVDIVVEGKDNRIKMFKKFLKPISTPLPPSSALPQTDFTTSVPLDTPISIATGSHLALST